MSTERRGRAVSLRSASIGGGGGSADNANDAAASPTTTRCPAFFSSSQSRRDPFRDDEDSQRDLLSLPLGLARPDL